MIRIVQINMHRSATAYESLAQLTVEIKADLMLISEQYMNRDPASWHPDLPNIAAIWVRDGALLRSFPQGRGDGFILIRCSVATFFRAYLIPNETMPNIQRKFDAFGYGEADPAWRAFNVRALEWTCFTQTSERNWKTGSIQPFRNQAAKEAFPT